MSTQTTATVVKVEPTESKVVSEMPSIQSRPARRVKSDVKYEDSSSSDENEDNDYNWHQPSTSDQPKPQHPGGNSPRRSTLSFPCDLCPTVFKRHGWLKIHMQKAHQKSTTTAPPAPNAKRSDSDQSPANKHSKHQRDDLNDPHTMRRHSGVSTTTAVHDLDAMADIASARAFFDALNPHASTVQHLDQMFKQTTKVMQWLKKQTARSSLPDFETTNEIQCELLAKQLKLYDAATQLIAAKRDSLQFAYDDFVNKHGDANAKAAAVEAAAAVTVSLQNRRNVRDKHDHLAELVKATLENVQANDADMTEDYSKSHRLDLDLDLSPDGRVILGGGVAKTNGNGEYAEPIETVNSQIECSKPAQPVNQSTQTDDGPTVTLSEIRIKDGDDFEFLDSKTGKLFTNKTPDEADDDDDDDDTEMDLVELIEVDEDF